MISISSLLVFPDPDYRDLIARQLAFPWCRAMAWHTDGTAYGLVWKMNRKVAGGLPEIIHVDPRLQASDSLTEALAAASVGFYGLDVQAYAIDSRLAGGDATARQLSEAFGLSLTVMPVTYARMVLSGGDVEPRMLDYLDTEAVALKVPYV